jgi:hypothetical protein
MRVMQWGGKSVHLLRCNLVCTDPYQGVSLVIRLVIGYLLDKGSVHTSIVLRSDQIKSSFTFHFFCHLLPDAFACRYSSFLLSKLSSSFCLYGQYKLLIRPPDSHKLRLTWDTRTSGGVDTISMSYY